MSNRLEDHARLPMISDPVLAGKVSQLVGDSRARAEQAMEMGEAYAFAFRGVTDCLFGIGRMIREAENLRDTHVRAATGLAFDVNNVPNAYIRSRLVGMG